MFVAWLISISLFFICIYSTIVIINGVKERDEYDLAMLQSQQNFAPVSAAKDKKQAV